MQTLDVDELARLITEYLLVCEVEGKSPHTLKNYRHSLYRFLKYARNSEITNARFIILNYLVSLNHLQPSSRNTLFRQTKALFTWAVDMEFTDFNPFDGLKNIRVPETIKSPFTSDDIRQMLKVTAGSSDREIRDMAIIMCLIDTGVRLGELVGINLQDIDFHSGRITIRKAKGGNDRVVPFASHSSRALRQYVVIRSYVPGPFFWKSTPMGSLIPNSPLAPAGVRAALIRVGDKAGVENVYPHRFRHSYATWAIRSNAREIDVQHLLGHRSPDMIRRYTRTYRSEQAAERHSEFSPGNRLLL
jgi:site-specific recombinase XerD